MYPRPPIGTERDRTSRLHRHVQTSRCTVASNASAWPPLRIRSQIVSSGSSGADGESIGEAAISRSAASTRQTSLWDGHPAVWHSRLQ